MIGDRLIAGFDENGSREGVAGLHRDTGEQLWKIDLGRGGVTVPFMWHEEAVWVVSGRRFAGVGIPSTARFGTSTPRRSRLEGWKTFVRLNDKVFLLGQSRPGRDEHARRGLAGREHRAGCQPGV